MISVGWGLLAQTVLSRRVGRLGKWLSESGREELKPPSPPLPFGNQLKHSDNEKKLAWRLLERSPVQTEAPS